MSGRYVRPDGDTVWVQNQVTPLVDEQHAASGLLCVCMDISARVRAENELRELNESLEERVATMLAQRESALAQLHEARKMEMVGQLTGGIAHDFNNLLTPIMASLELIRRRLDDARSTDLIDGALQSAERARNLVGRLLTFARRQTLKPQAVALRELVEGMHDLIERSLGPTIEVRIEIPERLPAVVVDPHQFELAILNLAVNARDAMGEGGRLEIGARTDLVIDGAVDGLGAGHYVCLEVADNGGGMPAEVLARCMEPFFSTKGVGKGTGLGLSMVQGLVAQSGGGLGIHSEIGKGTRVSIWLPITAEQTQSTAESCRTHRKRCGRPTCCWSTTTGWCATPPRCCSAISATRSARRRRRRKPWARSSAAWRPTCWSPTISWPTRPACSLPRNCASASRNCRCWSSPATPTSGPSNSTASRC